MCTPTTWSKSAFACTFTAGMSIVTTTLEILTTRQARKLPAHKAVACPVLVDAKALLLPSACFRSMAKWACTFHCGSTSV